MQQEIDETKSFQLLMLVEEEVRRSGGKALLSRQEYLEIVAYCYQEIYGKQLREHRLEKITATAN